MSATRTQLFMAGLNANVAWFENVSTGTVCAISWSAAHADARKMHGRACACVWGRRVAGMSGLSTRAERRSFNNTHPRRDQRHRDSARRAQQERERFGGDHGAQRWYMPTFGSHSGVSKRVQSGQANEAHIVFKRVQSGQANEARIPAPAS